jgi:hypothetical protein
MQSVDLLNNFFNMYLHKKLTHDILFLVAARCGEEKRNKRTLKIGYGMKHDTYVKYVKLHSPDMLEIPKT